MSESACGGASTGSVATDKGFLQQCPVCGRADFATPKSIAVHCSKQHDKNVSLRKELNSQNYLWQELIVKNVNIKDFADRLGVSTGTVYDALERNNMVFDAPHPWLSDELWLSIQYINRDKSQQEISDMLNVAKAVVINALDNLNINKPLDTKHQIGLKFYEKDLNRLVDRGKTIAEIADEVDCGTTTVKKWLNEFDIEIPKASGDNHHWWGGGKVKMQCGECGDMYEVKPKREDTTRFCSVECMAEWRSRNVTGEKHPNWEGGYDHYYGENWQEQRRKALRRDQYRCQRCHKSQAELGQEPDVHHITRLQHFKDNFDAPKWWVLGNDLENLITMCRTCHHKWEGIPLRIDNRQW